jgi:hypothetical protein
LMMVAAKFSGSGALSADSVLPWLASPDSP